MSNLRVNTLESLGSGDVFELDKLGYTFEYAAGVTVSSNSQIIKDGGLMYRASGSTALPYTTSGAGMPEGGAFVAVGDAMVSGTVYRVESTNDIKGMSAGAGSVFITGDGGVFVVIAGNYSNELQLDPFNGVFCSLESNPSGDMLIAKRVIKDSTVESAWFGVSSENEKNTLELQSSLDVASAIGAKTVTIPDGDIYIHTRPESNHPLCCITIPAGIHLKGAGASRTTMLRIPEQRTHIGMMFGNKGYNTEAGNLNAAGNITVSDMSISDGPATTSSRTGGNHLGFGNCRNIVVERVHFGNHDQHCVDLAGVDGAIIRDCTSLNETEGAYFSSATIQVDGVGGMAHATGVPFNTRNVLIENNHFININSQELLDIGHKPRVDGVTENIIIRNNILDGGYKEASRIIKFGRDSAFKDILIQDNIVKINHMDAFGIMPEVEYSDAGYNLLNNISITGNSISGKCRYAVLLGTYDPVVPEECGPIIISRNNINVIMESNNQVSGAIAITKVRGALVTDNNIVVNRPAQAGLTGAAIGIRASRASVKISNNTISSTCDAVTDLVSPPVYHNGIYITASVAAGGHTRIILSNNHIDQSKAYAAIRVSALVEGTESVLITGNTFYGKLNPNAITIRDYTGGSALDNGGVDAELAGGAKSLVVSAGQIVPVDNIGGLRTLSGEVRLVPTLKISGVNPSAIVNYKTETENVGTTLTKVGPDSFEIRTAKDGVCGYMAGAGGFLAAASGTLKVKVFI